MESGITDKRNVIYTGDASESYDERGDCRAGRFDARACATDCF